MTNQSCLRYLLAAATCCWLAGCLAAPDEEAEHLEHHIPAHKPATLIAAIAELERRNSMASRAEAAANAEQDRAELRDIIGWLPELAADSDLRKADWEAIQRLSLELAHAVELWRTAAPGTGNGAQRQYEEVLERLGEISRSVDSTAKLAPAHQETRSNRELDQSTATTSNAEEK